MVALQIGWRAVRKLLMRVLEFAVSNVGATRFAQKVVVIVDINVRTSSVLKGGGGVQDVRF